MHHEGPFGQCKEFKSVRLISPKGRRLPKPFNVRASHKNKAERSNNNVPASCNHSSSETAVDQKINAPDNTKERNANFPNPHMSVNNAYNLYAYHWPKNTILITGDSTINGINEKCISTNFKSVKVRYFSGATIDAMCFNLIPLLKKKTSRFSFIFGYQQFVR